jgi:hypothetical protein
LIHAVLPDVGIFFIHGWSKNMHPSEEDDRSIGMLSVGRYCREMDTDARSVENKKIYRSITSSHSPWEETQLPETFVFSAIPAINRYMEKELSGTVLKRDFVSEFGINPCLFLLCWLVNGSGMITGFIGMRWLMSRYDLIIGNIKPY